MDKCSVCQDSWSCFIEPYFHVPQHPVVFFNSDAAPSKYLCRFGRMTKGTFRRATALTFTIRNEGLTLWNAKIYHIRHDDNLKSLLVNKTIALFVIDGIPTMGHVHMYERTSIEDVGTISIVRSSYSLSFLRLSGRYSGGELVHVY